MRLDFAPTALHPRGTRLVAVVVAATALGACSLDFDALERGRRDAGRDLDARVPPPDAPSDAPASDARVDSGGTSCATPADCTDPACAGQPCDDGLACTTGDVCDGAACVGVALACPSDGCSVWTCQEASGGCVEVGSVTDGTACAGGVCCFGRCSNLADSGNCGGCGLGCDEETCTADAPPRCVCVTNAGCPLGQQCVANRCTCTSSTQCAAGQTCITPSGHCSY